MTTTAPRAPESEIQLILKGVHADPEILLFKTSLEAEAAYFGLSHTRTEGQGAILIPKQFGISPANFRLDRHWDGIREMEPSRIGLWTTTAEGYQVPTPAQLKAAAKLLELSGTVISQRLGVPGRHWRYWLAPVDDRRDIPWMAWRCIRLWIEEKTKET